MNNKINIIKSVKTNNIHQQDPNFVKEISWDDRFHLGKPPNKQANPNFECNKKIKIN